MKDEYHVISLIGGIYKKRGTNELIYKTETFLYVENNLMGIKGLGEGRIDCETGIEIYTSTRLLCPWNSPGKNTGMGRHYLLQGSFLTQGSNLGLLHCGQILYCLSHQRNPEIYTLLLLLLSHFSCVQLCATPEMAAHQAPPSLGFSRQEYWSGLPFPSPMHESEK